jgi:hypothetical protein
LLAADDQGATAAAAEARTILGELGAVTLLRGLPSDVPSTRGGEEPAAQPAAAAEAAPAAD